MTPIDLRRALPGEVRVAPPPEALGCLEKPGRFTEAASKVQQTWITARPEVKGRGETENLRALQKHLTAPTTQGDFFCYAKNNKIRDIRPDIYGDIHLPLVGITFKDKHSSMAVRCRSLRALHADGISPSQTLHISIPIYKIERNHPLSRDFTDWDRLHIADNSHHNRARVITYIDVADRCNIKPAPQLHPLLQMGFSRHHSFRERNSVAPRHISAVNIEHTLTSPLLPSDNLLP